MKKVFSFFNYTLILGVVLLSSKVYANPLQNKTMRTINLAGLVVDSKSLLPLENVNIYDEKGELIATTNSKGYFKGHLNYSNQGEINFKIKITKDGYYPYVQKENWANLTNNISAIYYFGIKQQNVDSSIHKAFSELYFNKDSTYQNVFNNFHKIEEKNNFNHKIEIVKSGNENIFFEIDDSFYLISDTGWLKLRSKDDIVSINGNKKIVASKLNSILKRKNVKKMTPSDSQYYSFELYTKNNH